MGDKTDDYKLTEDEAAYVSAEISDADFENRRKRALFLALFGTEAGKEVLCAIRDDICGVGVSCFSENPIEMARKAGRQEAFFRITEVLRIAHIEAEEDENVAR